ncbi:MAG: polysaccharide deacetylase family protein [Acidaminococcaceae bacterium]|nr:polysaccharide deacetylase family protein [Acidaminococcaceae bacterium]
MRVIYIKGVFYLAALFLLWTGRWGKISRKTAAVVSIICLLAGSGALAAAVVPWGNSYGITVNRLSDLPDSGKFSAPVSAVGSGKATPFVAAPGKTVPSIAESGRYIALTFDDGPYPPYTDRLLDVLKEKKIHVTFFLVAEQAQKYPELVKRMAAEGHTVGLHAFRHRDFLKLTGQEAQENLALGKKVLHDITGTDPVYWRPPHGFRDVSVMKLAVRECLTVVNWSAAPRDWTGIDRQEIYNRVMDKAEAGAIVLLHDGDSPFYKASRQATIDAVGPLIDSLREKGYHLVSLEEYVQREH